MAQVPDDVQDRTLMTEVPAIAEQGFEFPEDKLPIDNLLQDVQEVTNFVRQAGYAVDNLAHIIGERQFVNQTAGELLLNSTGQLQQMQKKLEAIARGTGFNVRSE